MSSVGRLQSLLSQHYPHYGQVHYEPIVLKGGQYRCRIILFGMTIDSPDLHGSWEEAREAVARLGFDLLTELFRILLHRPENDERLQMLFKPLQEALEASVVPPEPNEEEEAMVSLGLPPVVREEAIRQEAERTLEPAPFNPLLNAILRKLGDRTSSQGNVSQGNGVDITMPKEPKEPSKVEPKSEFVKESPPESVEEFNPVVALHHHWQRRMTSCEQPSYDYFSKQGYYGCILRYDGHEQRAEAHYRTKNGAKLEASRLLCITILGNAFVTMPPVPRDDLADAAKREATERLKREAELANREEVKIEARQELVGVETKQKIQPEVLQAAPTVAPLHGTMPVDGSGDIQPASQPISLSLPQGRKFVSLVNEYCQVAKLPQPDYQFSSGKSLSAYFVCYCDDFFDGDGERPREVDDRFISAAFAKKNDAKEDCAARIFLHLEQQGFVSREGQVLRQNLKGLVSRKRAVEMALQERAHNIRPKTMPFAPPPMPPAFPFGPGIPPPDPHFIAMLMQQQQQYFMQQQAGQGGQPPNNPPRRPPSDPRSRQ